MKLQRFVEVSDAPKLTIECYSDLDVSGGREGEVAIKTYGRDEDLEVVRERDDFKITSRARCKMGCPRGTILTIKAAHGNARVRRIDGPIYIENVGSDLVLKDVGATTAKTIGGDARARGVDGALELNQIGGDLVLKDVGPTTVTGANGDVVARLVTGDLQLNHVGGNLAARGVEGNLSSDTVGGNVSVSDLEGGLKVQAGGNVSLTADFTPGCDYQASAGGSVSVKMPENANASVKITANGDIHHEVNWSELTESAGSLTGVIGDGEANVTITAGGNVALKTRSDSRPFVETFDLEDEELDVELESMAEEIERSIQEQMAHLHQQLEAKLSRIDHEAIRVKAERAAEKVRRRAERAAERARLKAERAERRWERMGARRPPRPPQPPRELVTEEERLMVLRLVQEGKISADAAARLLEAMEG